MSRQTTTTDFAALAVELNDADAAAGLIPRHVEDEAVLLTVARLLAGVLERQEVTGTDAA